MMCGSSAGEMPLMVIYKVKCGLKRFFHGKIFRAKIKLVQTFVIEEN